MVTTRERPLGRSFLDLGGFPAFCSGDGPKTRLAGCPSSSLDREMFSDNCSSLSSDSVLIGGAELAHG